MAPARLAFALSLALAAAGSIAAHALAYALAAPDAAARGALLAATGHGYVDQLSLAIALGSLACGGFAAIAAASRAGLALARPRLWPFALVPPAAFAVQEAVERLAGPAGLDATLLSEKAFVVGLALQVPIGVVAWLATRTLLRAAVALGRVLRPGPLPTACSILAPTQPRAADLRARSVLALAHAGRAPPESW